MFPLITINITADGQAQSSPSLLYDLHRYTGFAMAAIASITGALLAFHHEPR
jgi:uncharacterized iron-regulated membrane protein